MNRSTRQKKLWKPHWLCLLLIPAMSGCAWFGWGSDNKPAPLTPLSGANVLSMAWSASVGKSAGFAFTPGFADRAVYVAGNDGGVYALSEEAGRVVNKFETKSRLTAGVGIADNLLVVGAEKGDVIALDAGGRQLWKTSVAGEILPAPSVISGNVIVRTTDGRLIAYNRIDGKRKWVFQRTTPPLTLRSSAGIASSRGVAYVGYPGGKVAAIEADSGKPVWEAALSLPRGSTELERVADVSGVPVLDDARVCAAVYQGRTGCLETLTGNVVWSREISSAGGVAIDAKQLYVADVDGNVFALDKTSGTTAWKFEKLARRSPGTPVLMKGKVLLGDIEGTVHALSAENGNFTGRQLTDGSPIMSLTQNGDRVIAQTAKGGVFSIAVK